MKQTPLLTVVIAGVVGAASAAATALFFTPDSSNRARVAAASPTGQQNDYGREIGELRRQSEDLLLRIAALESRPAPVASVRAPIADDGSADDLRSGPASFEDPSGEVPQAFVASVGDALDQIRDQEREERRTTMAEAQAERLEERLTELQAELGLSAYQVDELRPVLTAQNEKRAEFFSAGWENIDRGSIRETMQAIREETDQALGTILTPEQLEGYGQSERRDRGGFGGGRGGERDRGDRGGDRGRGGR